MTDNRGWRGTSEIVVVGPRAVREALTTPTVEVLEVRVDRGPRARPYRTPLTEACRDRGVPCTSVATSELEALSRDRRHDGGVAARIRLTLVRDVEDAVEPWTTGRRDDPLRVLAADNVTNPQNLGMLVRSAVGFGMDGVLWPLTGCPWIGGLVVKSSAATALRCPILTCRSLAEGVAVLLGAGAAALGLIAEGEDELPNVDVPDRLVAIVGGEVTGIGPEVAALLDRRVRIPMAAGVESLNAAVAGSILCYELARRRTLGP